MLKCLPSKRIVIWEKGQNFYVRWESKFWLNKSLGIQNYIIFLKVENVICGQIVVALSTLFRFLYVILKAGEPLFFPFKEIKSIFYPKINNAHYLK